MGACSGTDANIKKPSSNRNQKPHARAADHSASTHKSNTRPLVQKKPGHGAGVGGAAESDMGKLEICILYIHA